MLRFLFKQGDTMNTDMEEKNAIRFKCQQMQLVWVYLACEERY